MLLNELQIAPPRAMPHQRFWWLWISHIINIAAVIENLSKFPKKLKGKFYLYFPGKFHKWWMDGRCCLWKIPSRKSRAREEEEIFLINRMLWRESVTSHGYCSRLKLELRLSWVTSLSKFNWLSMSWAWCESQTFHSASRPASTVSSRSAGHHRDTSSSYPDCGKREEKSFNSRHF